MMIFTSFVMLLQLLASFASGQTPAKPCDHSACKLPDCLCASEDIPGGDYNESSIPQIVTINFDDALRRNDYEAYHANIFNDRVNPNGCQIGLTFFNSHDYTDYAVAENVHLTYGYEFAIHSVTHRTPTTWWEDATEEQLKEEIVGQKSILNTWGGIPSKKIRGYRGPFLATSENHLKVLHDNDFLYDATMSSNKMYWPFTLDYKSPICNHPATCPTNSYTGLWIVPHRPYIQSNGFTCAMLDACTAPFTEDQWFDFLVENFNIHYSGNRAPFGIYSHAAWFIGWAWRVNAMNRFLDYIGALDDVYVVTQTQMLDWVRNPTPLGDINSFAPWQCPATPPKARCDYKSPSCLATYFAPFYINLKSCTTPCPPNYPGVGNPQGL